MRCFPVHGHADSRTATGMIEKDKLTSTNVEERFADTRDTLCYATWENQQAVTGILQTDADLAIVVGGYNASNTSHLVERCELKLPTYFIKNEECLISAQQISHFDFHKHTELITDNYLPANRPLRIMVTSGASCPDALVERVIERLAELTGNENALLTVAQQWQTV